MIAGSFKVRGCGQSRAEVAAFRPARLYCKTELMKPSIPVKQKKRGRPATGVDPFVGVRFPVETLDAIDAWADRAGDGVTRSEAIRRLVELGLKTKEGKRDP